MARQETSPFILFIGKHPFIYYTLFINELNGGTLGNVPILEQMENGVKNLIGSEALG